MKARHQLAPAAGCSIITFELGPTGVIHATTSEVNVEQVACFEGGTPAWFHAGYPTFPVAS